MTQRRMNLPRSPEGRRLRPVGLTPQEVTRRLLYSHFQQTVACLTAMLTMVTVGTVYGWSMTAPLRLKSKADDTQLQIEQDEYSWLISLIVFGSMTGSIMCAQFADRYGRKFCLLVCSGMMTVGWLTIYTATSVKMLYLARVIHGMGIGFARTINPMYVSEVADISFRGTLATLITVTTYVGTMIICVLQFWLASDKLVLILILMSIISFVSNTCFPETPYFLVAKGRRKKACMSLAYYKDILDSNEAETEIRTLRTQTEYELHPKSRYELDQQSKSISSAQSVHERHSDSSHKARTAATPHLHLPSSSDSPSIYVVHREVVCDVHQRPTGESREASSRELVAPPLPESPELSVHRSRELHSQSTSELHRSSKSEVQRPSESEIQRQSASELHRPATSVIQRSPSNESRSNTSYMIPDLPLDIEPQARSDLYSQSYVDSSASTDSNQIHMDGSNYTAFTKLEVILQGSNRRALFIMFGLIVAQQLGGYFITVQYTEKLYRKINIVRDSHKAMLLVLGINIVSSSYTVYKVDSVGRRLLLLISTMGTCITLYGLAYYLLPDDQELLHSPVVKFTLIVVLITYQVTFQFGLGTISTVLLCELFPTELRGFAGSIIVIFDGIIGFIVSKLYQLIIDTTKEYVAYHIFAASCILTFLIVFMWMPETKGKTYNEIKLLLVSKTSYFAIKKGRINERNIQRT